MSEVLIAAFRLFNPWLAFWEAEPVEIIGSAATAEEPVIIKPAKLVITARARARH